MPETSIIIRAFNEAEYIGDVLEAVDTQEYQDFEIILVDSGSTDGTLEIAEEYVDTIEFVSPQNFTFGYSCNVGCEAASGDYCSFLSAHAIPTDDQWLGNMIKNLSEDDVAMTYSNQVGAETTKHSERRLFNELFPEKRRRQTPPDYWANNASSAIKKNLWEEHQFNEYLTGHEDIEWAKHFMDQGYVVVYEPEACIYHIHDETWDQVFNRFEREAIADVEIGIKDRSDRWAEYLKLPKDIAGDMAAMVKNGGLSKKKVAETVQFRYNQHMGTVSGLLSDPDLEADRYEYYYADANESVYLDSNGSITIEQHPLPEIKPNEVLIETNYVGVESNIRQPTDKNNYPIVPNGNYVGTVVDIGANANSVEIGDTVVGGTTFDCSICAACNATNQICENPIRLGIDTDEGPFSQVLPVPSNHVWRLPDGINSRDGTLVRLISQIVREIDQATLLAADNTAALVIGNSVRARITAQILELSGIENNHISECSHEIIENIDLQQYNLVVDVTGDKIVVERCMKNLENKTILLLLGNGYGDLTLDDETLYNTTIMKPSREPLEDIERGIELLSKLDTERILDGTYRLEEYESAWKAAATGQQLPIIKI